MASEHMFNIIIPNDLYNNNYFYINHKVGNKGSNRFVTLWKFKLKDDTRVVLYL